MFLHHVSYLIYRDVRVNNSIINLQWRVHVHVSAGLDKN